MQNKILKNNLTTIILCGGKGKRLFPLTKNLPKPLIKINGKEILTYILKNQLKYNLNDIIIATGYKHKYFKEYQNRNKNYFSLKLINTNVEADIIERIIKCEKYCKEYVMVCYGDTIADINLDKLIRFFSANKDNIILSSYNLKSQFGLMKIAKSGKVKSFQEKPQLQQGWINGGYFVAEPTFFDLIDGDDTMLEREPLEQAATQKQLMAYKHDGFWHCMDTKRDHDLLESLCLDGAPWIR